MSPKSPRDDADPDDAPERGAEPESEPDGVSDGLDHLQVAAKEAIAAARSFLDAAEQLVGDRDALGSLAETFGDALATVSRVVAHATTPETDSGPDDADGGAKRAGGGKANRTKKRSGVQAIEVT